MVLKIYTTFDYVVPSSKVVYIFVYKLFPQEASHETIKMTNMVDVIRVLT